MLLLLTSATTPRLVEKPSLVCALTNCLAATRHAIQQQNGGNAPKKQQCGYAPKKSKLRQTTLLLGDGHALAHWYATSLRHATGELGDAWYTVVS